jgi:Entner-Doudoroff aldolase
MTTLYFKTRILPVIVISDVRHAVPMAHALLAGGIDAMEITLRHAAGLAAMEAVARAVPEMHVGAGTVTRVSEVAQVQAAGATFALSPGYSTSVLDAARALSLPFVPGVMTPSEVLTARDAGYTRAAGRGSVLPDRRRLAKQSQRLFKLAQCGHGRWLVAYPRVIGGGWAMG